MRRAKVNRKADSRIFSRTAMRVKSINVQAGLPYGGRNLNH